ncbi:uncharacterized protein LOC127798329 [Diospyros lotus]|uniref:uncharacterized protein LOC127798329 n=1 Tax=Diospyros lotus TaxID=55363 RepID=UPI0022505B70|nr:uncharacterized protein LOC127798329 [Diospyros lotus]
MKGCYNCGEEGHFSWNYPKKGLTCYNCQQAGHLSKDCSKKGIICYNCQQPGHFATDCTKSRQARQLQGPPENARVRQGRVFNLTQQDMAEDPTVIQGTMFISDFPMHVLIDSGASHSFISHALAKELGEEPEQMNCRMIVATPMGKSQETSSGYQDKLIQIGDVKFLVDLILLEIMDFDVILGMDFLGKYNASIDCKAKIVSLKIRDSIVKFRGQGRVNEKKWISALKAEKLLQNGAYGYLAHIEEKKEDLLKIEEVWIVNEFRDVFSEELPGLPP